MPWKILFTVSVSIAIMLAIGAGEKAWAQARRNIKVVLETKQNEAVNREGVQGSGSVIIRRGTAYPSGRIAGGERQTTVQRSSGIFTLVADGEIARQILGYRNRQSSGETSLAVTATLQ